MKYLIILSIIVLDVLHADIDIIASPSCRVEEVSKSDIKKLFMLKKRSINGESIKIMDSSSKITYKKFIKKYMNKSPRRMKTYWIRMLFTGKKIPPKRLSWQELNALDEHGCYLSYIKEEEQSKPKNWKKIKIK